MAKRGRDAGPGSGSKGLSGSQGAGQRQHQQGREPAATGRAGRKRPAAAMDAVTRSGGSKDREAKRRKMEPKAAGQAPPKGRRASGQRAVLAGEPKQERLAVPTAKDVGGTGKGERRQDQGKGMSSQKQREQTLGKGRDPSVAAGAGVAAVDGVGVAAAVVKAAKAGAAAAKGAATAAVAAAAEAVATADASDAAAGTAETGTKAKALAATINSNWEVLKAAVAACKKPPPPESVQRRRKAAAAAATGDGGGRRPGVVGSETGLTRVLALDCEMVGTGPKGVQSVLARVCIVNSAGTVVLDTFVKPKAKVTDYRTWVSGVRPSDIAGGRPHDEVIKEVHEMVKDRILVGHAIGNDLRALELESHPLSLLRDTSKYPGLMKVLPTGKKVSASLKDLATSHLGLTIQHGEHTPVDDARATLYLYQKFSREWEAAVRNGHLTPISGLGKKVADGKGRVKGRASKASGAGRSGKAKDYGRPLRGAKAGQVAKRKADKTAGGTKDGNNWRQRRQKRKEAKAGAGVGPAPLWSIERDPYADL